MPSEIPFIKPSFPSSADLANDIDEIVQSNWYTNFGPKEKQFVGSLENYLGKELSKQVSVAVLASGTAALIAATSCILGRGDCDRLLLMPSFSFIAVPQAAIWNGYWPWFIDIDSDHWQPCLSSARMALESSRDRVAGILLANTLGVGNPEIGRWEDLAKEWELPLIIDSAAGFGSRYQDGSHLGSRGDCEIFSFHATKPFGIGEGGALVSTNRQLIDQVNQFQNFGFDNSRVSHQLGMNSKLSELSAAIGLRQLSGLDGRLATRRQAYDTYRAALIDAGVTFQQNAENSSQFCASCCTESPETRDRVVQILAAQGVQARQYYNPPLHLHPYFSKGIGFCKMSDLSVTEDICSRIVSLPIHDYMEKRDIHRVAEVVRQGCQSGS